MGLLRKVLLLWFTALLTVLVLQLQSPGSTIQMRWIRAVLKQTNYRYTHKGFFFLCLNFPLFQVLFKFLSYLFAHDKFGNKLSLKKKRMTNNNWHFSLKILRALNKYVCI